MDYWSGLDTLVSTHRLIIDRPKGSHHKVYRDAVSPLDYGYLEGTTSGDGAGVDIWVGSLQGKDVTGVICTVDLLKGDVETKLLVGCTDEEAETALRCHNVGQQHAVLLKRPE
jgi:inorganic pyrophosphatase